MTILTAYRLKELYSYDPLTGHFTRLKTGKMVSILNTLSKGRSPSIRIDGKQYLQHRLAWLYMTENWPEYIIDHINADKHDNTWSNLRLAPGSINQINRPLFKNNTSGYTGITWSKCDKKWKVSIFINNKPKQLGQFTSIDDAKRVRKEAEAKYYGDALRCRENC